MLNPEVALKAVANIDLAVNLGNRPTKLSQQRRVKVGSIR